MKTPMLQHLINHVSLIVDASSSMVGQPVVQVFDRELSYLKQRSVELNQETRISIYLFGSTVTCLAFDMDVMRFTTLQGFWQPDGMTALIDAVLLSTEDHKKLPELYGDHAFLQYVLTDGGENHSRATALTLQSALNAIADNWTTACLVPSPVHKHEVKKFGFAADSVAIWDTNEHKAFEKVGTQFRSAMDNYMSMRASGTRSTKSFFTLDSTTLKAKVLDQLDPQEYDILPVRQDCPIKEYVELFMGEKYRLGSAYYMPTKKVKIQDHKNILVQNAKNGKVYEGSNIRSLLGLPAHTVEVDPGSHRDWRVFVQSTSTNRKLYKDTFVLVRD